MQAERRKLTFSSLNEVMQEVDRLMSGPYVTVGTWSFDQILKHLTEAITYSVGGYPELAPWLIRKTIGKFIARSILKKGVFPNGIKLPKKFEPKASSDPRAEAEALRAAINYFSGYTGELSLHPLAEKISRDEWTRFHCIHCAHHLGFVVPTAA